MSSSTILVSGGAGYIGSHACYALKQAGYQPVAVDDLSTGNKWAVSFGPLEQIDIGDPEAVRKICSRYEPIAAMHFAAFIDVAESVKDSAKYFATNRDKASRFFRTLNNCKVRKVVFSSTAAVYGNVTSNEPITELQPIDPINPYGSSKMEAEAFLRMLDGGGMRSVTLRYFNVAGAGPADAKIGEAHKPETHLIPRMLLPLLDAPLDILSALDLENGPKIFGTDYSTPDGTAIRDYIHVMDLIDAHLRALDYLLNGGTTEIFNLGTGTGYSVRQIVDTVRSALNKPDFDPETAPRRAGDPAFLVASNQRAGDMLGWKPTRTLEDIVRDAAAWHKSQRYRDTIRRKIEKDELEALENEDTFIPARPTLADLQKK
jgi:UDP-glucose-4-epimerase GalE